MTERPRVLYVITDPISTRLLRGQLAMLRDEGFDVHLATADGPELAAFARTEGVAAHVVPMVREPSVWRDLRALISLVALVVRLRPALVHSSTPKAGLLGTLAAWLTRRPVRVYLVRGLRFETAEGRQRTLYLGIERFVARRATHVMFNSASTRKVAEDEGIVAPGAGIVLAGGSGNGLDVSRLDDLPSRAEVRERLGLDHDAAVLGFVGRLTADKGIDDLVAVVERLGAAGRDVRLLLVGTIEEADPPSARTRAFVETDPRVVTTGWVDDPVGLYPAMDLLVFPSRREGLPNVPLEAQAAGVPVVGYAATGTVDAVVDGTTGRLVEVGDVAALAAAVDELLGDDVRRAAMATAGCDWVRSTFSQERVWTELVAAYRSWLA